jgi:hypothetical protein
MEKIKIVIVDKDGNTQVSLEDPVNKVKLNKHISMKDIEEAIKVRQKPDTSSDSQ